MGSGPFEYFQVSDQYSKLLKIRMRLWFIFYLTFPDTLWSKGILPILF